MGTHQGRKTGIGSLASSATTFHLNRADDNEIQGKTLLLALPCALSGIDTEQPGHRRRKPHSLVLSRSVSQCGRRFACRRFEKRHFDPRTLHLCSRPQTGLQHVRGEAERQQKKTPAASGPCLTRPLCWRAGPSIPPYQSPCRAGSAILPEAVGRRYFKWAGGDTRQWVPTVDCNPPTAQHKCKGSSSQTLRQVTPTA